MTTRSSGSRTSSARRSMCTVFRLISDVFAERRKELDAPSRRAERGRPSVALLEDVALENSGRRLELDELANRISVLGFEHFGQRLNLVGAFEQKPRRTRAQQRDKAMTATPERARTARRPQPTSTTTTRGHRCC